MKCTICGTSINSIEDVLNDDWTYSFFDGDDEHGPLCPSCSDILLSMANDGEYELIRDISGFNYPIKIVVSIEKNIMTVITNYPLKKGQSQ